MFLALVVCFGAIYVREALAAKKRKKRFIESLYHLSEDVPQKEYSLERFAKINTFFLKHPGKGQIDDITWNDLGMDDIFMRMNYTYSASGEEYLYYKLRNTLTSEAELEHLENIIGYYQEHPEERVKTQYCMSELGYTGKFSLYDYIDHLEDLGERSNRKHILANLLYIPFVLMLVWDLSIAISGIAILCIYHIATYFREKNEINPYIISFAYIRRLAVACEGLIKINSEACKEELEQIKIHKKNLGSVGKGSYWVFCAEQGKVSGNPLDILMDYIRMVFHIDLIMFNKMLSHLRSHEEDVDALIETVGFLETAIAIGIFRDSLEEVCIPQFEGNALMVENAYHPLLIEPVKNSIHAGRGVLLTGSNASGKSTFLKTVAINSILAQTIHTCCASFYRAPFYEIYSSMALHDDIGSGESYYIVEIKALKRILDAVSRKDTKVLCFVDEVLRGTNTVERIAASTQILKSLAESGNTCCFAATHDIELTELLKEEFDNYHFEENIIENDIVFPYKLLEGPATTRNAIRLLELMGYRHEVIVQAMKQAEGFVESGKWSL